MPFDHKYLNLKELVSSEIEQIETYISERINIENPLNEYIKVFFNTGAKRVRLVLPLLFIKSLGKKPNKKQLEALSAIEIIHNASLIHDDIIDESDTRRGIESVSNKFGNKTGVIAGDYLLSLGMEILVELNNSELLKSFSNTLKEMCKGEIKQNFNRFKIGTIEEYIDKSKNKTAYLFETAMLSTILFDNSINENFKNSALSFGLNTGIAFQIRDDLINLTGDEDGKPSKNDLEEGIYTAPVIYAQSAENYSQGIEKTRNLLNNYIEKARENLKFLPDNKYKEGLESFLGLLKYE